MRDKHLAWMTAMLTRPDFTFPNYKVWMNPPTPTGHQHWKDAKAVIYAGFAQFGGTLTTREDRAKLPAKKKKKLKAHA